jgi:hypothetical protein
MRKFMLSTAALAASMALAACATTGSGDITVQDVQGAAVAACSYLPTAASVASLLNANGAIMTAEAIAQVICAAVTTTQSAKLRGAPGPVTVTVQINGKPVTVTGSFVAAVKGRRVQ